MYSPVLENWCHCRGSIDILNEIVSISQYNIRVEWKMLLHIVKAVVTDWEPISNKLQGCLMINKRLQKCFMTENKLFVMWAKKWPIINGESMAIISIWNTISESVGQCSDPTRKYETKLLGWLYKLWSSIFQ